MRTAQPHLVACRRLRRIHLFPHMLLILTLLAALPVASLAQAQNSAPAKPAAKKSATKAHKRAKAVTASAPEAPKTPAPVPQAPPKPDWPVYSRATPASIRWNASGLRIEASNSSLQQILKEVATLTGATVEGLGSDERVFGVYGPGPAREVLARLFDGSGYNMVMIGDQGQGTPRQILLSQRDGKAGVKSTAAAGTDDNDDDLVEEEQPEQQQQQQPPQPPLVRNFNPQGNGAGNGPPQPSPDGQQRPQ